MQTYVEDKNLLLEEWRTLKWFLTLFYLVSISFDVLYGLVIPRFTDKTPVDTSILQQYWVFIIFLGLLPIAFYLKKNNRVNQIKYVYFITYIAVMLIKELIIYTGSPGNYGSGNAAEVLWLLLAPIFVNSRFFKVVLTGLFSKYVIIGVALQTASVLFPILLFCIISIFSYILLSRFQAHIKAVQNSYDQQLMGIVKGIIATLELKDPYTRGHSERVAAYAHLLAVKLGKFSEEELKEFNYACLLHDIGKIHIPDHILMKPTSLTKEEYEIIKTHPSVGAEAMSKIDGFKNNLDVILFHHERWDGKGYPSQLQGDHIPFLARVSAIADAFDAMTSSRSYRGAMPVEDAYQRIIKGAGTQFDPDLVEVFKDVYPSWIEIHNQDTGSTKSSIWKEKNSLEVLYR